MANITVSEVSPAMPEFWLARAIGRLKANLVMARLVRRDVDGVVAEQGETVNIIKRGSLTVRDKTANNDVQSDAPANTKIPVKLDQHKYVSWHLEDTASAKAIDDAVNYVEDGMQGLAEAVEASLLALHSDIATEVGVAGLDLSETSLLRARKALNDQKCPQLGRAMIVSTKDEISLLEVDKFTRADAIGNQGEAIREASLGRLYGFDTYMSQLVDTTPGAPDITHNVAFHRNAFVLASRPMPLPQPGSGALGAYVVDTDIGIAMRYTRQWDSDALKTKHVIDILFGVKSVDEDRHAVEVIS